METQTTFMESKYHFIFKVMLFTFLLFASRGFSQIPNFNQYGDFKPIQVFHDSLVGNDYQNKTRLTNTYDDHGFLTNTLSESHDNTTNVYTETNNITYTNTGDGKPNVILIQKREAGNWVDVSKVTIAYNGAGKISTITVDVVFNSSFQTFSKQTNTYDSNGFLIYSVTQNLDLTSLPLQLKDQSQTTFTNNTNGTPQLSVTETKNPITGAFERSVQVTYTYYNNGPQVHMATTEEWINNSWVKSSQITNTYEGANFKNVLHEKWVVVSGVGSWKNESQSSFFYVNGKLSEVVHQNWVDPQGWVNVSRERLTYDSLGIGDFVSANNFAVYPVPAYDNITVRLNTYLQGSIYRIFDQNGRVFKSGSLNPEDTNVDINQLASGVYFFQIGQNKSQTVKIIKR